MNQRENQTSFSVEAWCEQVRKTKQAFYWRLAVVKRPKKTKGQRDEQSAPRQGVARKSNETMHERNREKYHMPLLLKATLESAGCRQPVLESAEQQRTQEQKEYTAFAKLKLQTPDRFA